MKNDIFYAQTLMQRARMFRYVSTEMFNHNTRSLRAGERVLQ